VSSLTYPACNEHAPCYIAICSPAPLYNIFPHYLINGTIFGKKKEKKEKKGTEHKMSVLIFSTTFVRDISRSKQN
jgi:hypothetical protein